MRHGKRVDTEVTTSNDSAETYFILTPGALRNFALPLPTFKLESTIWLQLI